MTVGGTFEEKIWRTDVDETSKQAIWKHGCELEPSLKVIIITHIKHV